MENIYRGMQHSHFKIKTNPSLSINTQADWAPQLFGRLRRPKLSSHRPNSNNRVKYPISKVSKGPNRVRDKPEDRTTTQRVHSITAFDDKVDGMSGTGTEGGLAPS